MFGRKWIERIDISELEKQGKLRRMGPTLRNYIHPDTQSASIRVVNNAIDTVNAAAIDPIMPL